MHSILFKRPKRQAYKNNQLPKRDAFDEYNMFVQNVRTKCSYKMFVFINLSMARDRFVHIERIDIIINVYIVGYTF